MNAFQIILLLFASVILLLLLILLLPVKLHLFFDGKLILRLKILFLSFPVYPKKKKWKMKDHLPEYQKKKKRKTSQRATHPSNAKEEEKESPLERIAAFFSFTQNLLEKIVLPLLERLGRYLTVDISRLEITVGSDDAAKTALLYAAALNGSYALLAFLDEHTVLKKKRNASLQILCRYDQIKTTAKCEVEFGICLLGALCTVMPALLTYLNEYAKEDPRS
ncbi:MAG: hypothetical protein J6M12_01790 [Clostridia bacterium]|nr:hypothetical protein [Clostridia bacterium]